MPGSRERFPTTSWDLVAVAGGTVTIESAKALAQLCEAYWYPLYAYVRRAGYSVEDAQDLTQGFFALILERRYFRDADRERGRLRSFLLASLKHFMANEWDRAHAARRGGGSVPVPVDAATAEERYRLEPADPRTPETVFDRRWALTLMDRTLLRLREHYASAQKADLFRKIEDFLTEPTARGGYELAAAELDMTEGAFKVAVHRARRRFGVLLRREVAGTMASAEDVQDEVRHLLAALDA